MKTTRLLRLLDAELIDAQEDLRDLERTLAERFSQMEITAYVYRENSAVLEWEIHGIERMRGLFNAIKGESFADPAELVAHIHAILRDHVDHHDMPGAVESIVRRRLARLLPLLDCP